MELSLLDYAVFILYMGLVVALVSALLWPRSNNFSATATLLLCIPMTLRPAILKALRVDVNSFVLAGILLIPIVVFHVVMSHVRSAPAPEKASQWIWKPDMLFLPAGEEVIRIHGTRISFSGGPWSRRPMSSCMSSSGSSRGRVGQFWQS